MASSIIAGDNNDNANLNGTAADDIIYGLAGYDILRGFAGNDQLDGGAGFDDMYGGIGNDIYIVDNLADFVFELTGEGYDVVYTSVNFSLTTGNNNADDFVEALILEGTAANGEGNTLNNLIIGNDQANVLTGLGGDDQLDGGLGGDTLVGGSGNDTYVVDNTADQVLETAGNGFDIVQSNVSYTLSSNLEQLILTGIAVAGTGNDLNNIIIGNGQANTLSGGSGDDTVYGLDGADTINGGDGNDVMFGGAGADTMVGGLGSDTYYVDDAGDIVDESTGGGVDTVISLINDYALTAGIETLVLGAGAVNGTASNEGDSFVVGNEVANTLTGGGGSDRLIGEGGNDTLIGGLGNDVLSGGVGADTMIGGGDNDSYFVDNFGDLVTELAGGGTDQVFTTITLALSAHVENLILLSGAQTGIGNDLANVLVGNEANNSLEGLDGNDTLIGGAGADILSGSAGNDELIGGTGEDSMYGGAGNDSYYVDVAADQVNEDPDGGYDIIFSSAQGYQLRANTEQLVLLDGAVVGVGNAGESSIYGNAGNNTLKGLGGFDVLFGGAGADTFAYDSRADGADYILDFIPGEDKIGLRSAGFGGMTGVADGANFFSGPNPMPATASPTLLYQATTGNLFFDLDGTGTAEGSVLIATLTNRPDLHGTDILLT